MSKIKITSNIHLKEIFKHYSLDINQCDNYFEQQKMIITLNNAMKYVEELTETKRKELI